MPWKCPVCGEGGATETPPERCAACDAHLGDVVTAEGRLDDSSPPVEPAADAPGLTRRKFFQVAGVVAGLGAVGAASVTAFKFLQPVAPVEAPNTIVLGPANVYPEGPTFVEAAKAFIERRGRKLRCLSAVCTHLGCIVQWRPGESRFHCPCHGSDFAADGALLTGPASKPLPFLKLVLDASGRLVVHRLVVVQRGQEWLEL